MIWKTDDKNLKRLNTFERQQMLALSNGSKIVKIPKPDPVAAGHRIWLSTPLSNKKIRMETP